jgi:hypothetical protein
MVERATCTVKRGTMTILIDLGGELLSEAVYQLLITNGHDDVVVSGRSAVNGFTRK